MRVHIGIDTGGTFTDVIAFREADGRLVALKVPSTPWNPAEAFITGVRAVLDELGTAPGDVGFLAHGTTVATNAVLERKGARTGLITTEGFRDVYEIRRLNRSYEDLYNVFWTKPAPLVPRYLRREVRERVNVDGVPIVPLDPASVREAAAALGREGVEAVAVCFLHAYRNPVHEQQAAALIREVLPGVSISLSHEINPEYREYERTSTTIVNAFVAPIIERYLADLERRLADAGVPASLHVMHSGGAAQTGRAARSRPITTILSGPAAGVIGAEMLAREIAQPDLITLDMGGTSTDVALLRHGKPRLASESEVAGEVIRTAMLDITTIGAGGGSIAWCDEGGRLKVGPQSAGADPGPACYARGGTQPTVTDANLVLGYLAPDAFLGGRMRLDRAAAEAAIDRLAAALGLSRLETAHGIFRIANANMLRAIRIVSVERGLDPRRFALLAFGGAGPVHAAALAAELDIPRVIVPQNPGNFSAFGLLVADLSRDAVRTQLTPLRPESFDDIRQTYAQLEAQLADQFVADGFDRGQVAFRRSVEARYVGQAYEVNVPVPGETLTTAELAALAEAFHAAHAERYGHSAPGEPVELVNFRAIATVPTAKPRFPRLTRTDGDGAAAQTGVRPAWFDGRGDPVPTPVLDRRRLGAGVVLTGPAIIEEPGATTVLLPGQRAEVDDWGNIVIAVGRAGA
ncbi:MAG: hydantoinase/oxoprolinase family protein [Sphaerobacter sp.]|nr:hydantoinase/oxoprolinase family protein [Sphaerobacter sp.]